MKYRVLEDLKYHRGPETATDADDATVTIPAGSVVEAVPRNAWSGGDAECMGRHPEPAIFVSWEGSNRMVEHAHLRREGAHNRSGSVRRRGDRRGC